MYLIAFSFFFEIIYSHLFLINMEVGINVEGGISWKKLVHKCNKRGVEGGFFFSKSVSMTSRLLERGEYCFRMLGTVLESPNLTKS